MNKIAHSYMNKNILRSVFVSIIAFLVVFNASSDAKKVAQFVTIGDFRYDLYIEYKDHKVERTAVLTRIANQNLRNLQLPDTVRYGEILYDKDKYLVVGIGESAFSGCSYLTGPLTIPESIISIGDCAFQGCSGFTGPLTIGNSVTSIGNEAFYQCRGLTGPLTIGSSVKTIGDDAFNGCWNIAGPLTIPESVTSIGKGVFMNCWSLTGPLVIPESVTSIGNSAFYFCDGLTGSLTIGNSVTKIGGNAFRGCIGFSGPLTIGNSVISIGDGAFDGCIGFTGPLTIPESVTSIGDGAFQGCNGFAGPLTIGNSVWTIGENAFNGCAGLTGPLTIGNSVETIGDNAFNGCTGLTGSLTIGNSVKLIGFSAFEGCDNFESIKCLNPNPPQLCYNSFPHNTDIIIRVPAGSGVAYSSSGWKALSTNIYEIGDVNHSDKITVSDAVADANYIIGIEPVGTFDEICGDMNLDDRVSLIDVSQIIDAISEYNSDDIDANAEAISWVSAMTNDELKVLRSNNGISGITVDCDYDVTALQCDIHADGIRIEDIILDNSLEKTHSLTVSQINDDTVRAIVFSMESAIIDKSKKILWLDIDKTSQIEIKNIIIANPNALEYDLPNVIALGITSNIDSIDLEPYSLSCQDGYLHISDAVGKQLNVYDISGKTVYRSAIFSNDYSVSLAPGLYIIAIDSYRTKLIVDK